MDVEFEIDQIVWSKLGRYPWWPGYIYSKNSTGIYEVCFFGDFSRSIIPANKIRCFQEFGLSTKERRKKLIYSYNIARAVFNKESTIIEEINKYNDYCNNTKTNSRKPIKKLKRNIKKIKKTKIIEKNANNLNFRRKFSEKKNFQNTVKKTNKKFSLSTIHSEDIIIITNQKWEKFITEILEEIKKDNPNLDEIKITFNKLINDVISCDDSILYSSNIGIYLQKVKEKIKEKSEKDEEYKKFYKFVNNEIEKISNKVVGGFFNLQNSDSEFIGNFLKINSNLNNNSLVMLKNKQFPNNPDLTNADDKTILSETTLELNSRVIYRVRKKMFKVLYISGGRKAKLLKKTLRENSDKIESLIRKKAINFDMYKNQVLKVIKYFESPKNVYEKLLKNYKNFDSESFLEQQIFTMT